MTAPVMLGFVVIPDDHHFDTIGPFETADEARAFARHVTDVHDQECDIRLLWTSEGWSGEGGAP